MDTEGKTRLERNIGLCMAAGGVTVGFDLILKEVRSKNAKFVLLASDASQRTKKQITDKCSFYGIRCFLPDLASGDVSKAVGKHCSCVAAAFTGKGPWQTVMDALENQEK
jgi:ribosomal protein L7Ae-like RNA K-turn-binding protein